MREPAVGAVAVLELVRRSDEDLRRCLRQRLADASSEVRMLGDVALLDRAGRFGFGLRCQRTPVHPGRLQVAHVCAVASELQDCLQCLPDLEIPAHRSKPRQDLVAGSLLCRISDRKHKTRRGCGNYGPASASMHEANQKTYCHSDLLLSDGF